MMDLKKTIIDLENGKIEWPRFCYKFPGISGYIYGFVDNVKKPTVIHFPMLIETSAAQIKYSSFDFKAKEITVLAAPTMCVEAVKDIKDHYLKLLHGFALQEITT